MAKYNWEKIKAEYVEGIKDEKGDIKYPTLKELSEKYRCSYLYIQQVSSKNNWTQEHKIYIRKISELKREKKSEVLASESAEFDSKTLELAKAGESFIKIHFAQAGRNFKKDQELMDDEKIERLGRALINYQKAGKLALGEATDKQDQNITIIHAIPDHKDEN